MASAYNQSSITRIIDPIIDVASNRVEFKFPSNTLLSANVRVLNLGAVLQSGEVATDYNRLAGGLASIKNIYLENNGETIDQILDVNSWIAFKEQRKSHEEAQSVSRNLTGNGLGLTINQTLKLGRSIETKGLKDTLAASGKCMMNLKDVLPFFAASQVIPTAIFSDLRLIIEYDTDVVKLSTRITTLLGTIMLNPFISVEEVLDRQLVAQMTADYQGVSFQSIERDLATISTTKATTAVAVADTPTDLNLAVNRHSAQLRGYDNKYLSRLLIVVKTLAPNGYKASVTAVAGGGGLGGVSVLRPVVNVVVNGSNKLAGVGLNSQSEVQARCIDTWGDLCVSAQANAPSVFDSATVYQSALEYVGYQSYIGLEIREFIQNLTIDFGFSAQVNSDTLVAADQSFDRLNADMHLLVFGECRKSIMMGGSGGYTITYM